MFTRNSSNFNLKKRSFANDVKMNSLAMECDEMKKTW